MDPPGSYAPRHHRGGRIPVVMSLRESLYQTNSGVDPTTGLVAGGESFVGLQNYTNIFAGQNLVTFTVAAPWTGSGTRS